MYCYVCLTYVARGGSIYYSYRNALTQTVTGTIATVNSLSSLLAILGITTNTLITFNAENSGGTPMGVIEQVLVNGMSMCIIHAVPGISS